MRLSARANAFVLAALFVFGSSACLVAQAGRSTGSNASGRITVDVVVDQKGSKPPATVAGLQQQDFALLDNKAPRTFTSFRAVSAGQEPIRVIVLVDAVNIRLQGLAYERDQLTKFFRAHDGQLMHPTALAILTDQGLERLGGFTNDGNALSESLRQQDIGLRTIRRGQGIYGAEDQFGISINGLRSLATPEAGQRPVRTAILWISPGWPLLSGPGIDLSQGQQKQVFSDIVNLSTLLREARATLYAIDPLGANESLGRTFDYEQFLKGIGKFTQVDVGDLSLQVLAIQSGGMALNSNDTGALLQRCVADLDNYYEISFDAPPAETRDAYHHLELRVDKPGMVARTRDGYYAQPLR